MALTLNKRTLLFVLIVLMAFSVFSQEEPEHYGGKDYKDPDQHDRFFRRRKLVGAWQINQLKTGALVVRLKTNKTLIDALRKNGNEVLAEKKRLETLAMNLNISRAFRTNYDFSKVYFIYSNSSDSLLNGARSNIFLDTNLSVDPSIVMNEKFYLLAERDYIYNSSIGFVPEDSAKVQVEAGNPTTQAGIVVKNKYGHQLKKPFPYNAYLIGVLKSIYYSVVVIHGKEITFNVENPVGIGSGDKIKYDYNGKPLILAIPKDFTYDVYSVYVSNLNSNFYQYYRENRSPESNKYFKDCKPFLY
jgi:hypothetical protein